MLYHNLRSFIILLPPDFSEQTRLRYPTLRALVRTYHGHFVCPKSDQNPVLVTEHGRAENKKINKIECSLAAATPARYSRVCVCCFPAIGASAGREMSMCEVLQKRKARVLSLKVGVSSIVLLAVLFVQPHHGRCYRWETAKIGVYC